MTNKNQIVVSDYINTNYREYSIYINNSRAIPSVVDGFKPVQRKAIFTAIKQCRNDFIKVSSLAGAIINIAAYHHGDAAAQDAIVKMAQDFNNNVPFLDQDGSFGTRLSPTASAGRYIFVKLSESFYDIFKDSDIAPSSVDSNDHPEPLYYLPIIPNVLLNGANGIAVGFATTILPRSANTLATAAIQYLKKGTVPELMPHQVGFDGTFTKDLSGGYVCNGVMTQVSKTKVVVTELPIGITHEKYQEHLIKLRDKGVILSFVDRSDSKFNFEITLPRNNTYSKDKLERELKINSAMKENIVVVDDFNTIDGDKTKIAIKTYDNAEQVLKDFVDFRLKFYQKRIDFNIARLQSEILLNEQKIKFIKDVLSKKIKIGDMTRKMLVEYMEQNKYVPEYISNIIGMSIYNMTKDNMDSLLNEINEKTTELNNWKSASPTNLYIDDLNVIKKKYK